MQDGRVQARFLRVLESAIPGLLTVDRRPKTEDRRQEHLSEARSEKSVRWRPGLRPRRLKAPAAGFLSPRLAPSHWITKARRFPMQVEPLLKTVRR